MKELIEKYKQRIDTNNNLILKAGITPIPLSEAEEVIRMIGRKECEIDILHDVIEDLEALPSQPAENGMKIRTDLQTQQEVKQYLSWFLIHNKPVYLIAVEGVPFKVKSMSTDIIYLQNNEAITIEGNLKFGYYE